MLSEIGNSLLNFRRFFSRSEWAIRILRLSKSKAGGHPRGLVMVQIDGLSLSQFNRAMAKNHLPFLRTLLEKERYVLHSHYSGLPSNTPAVQGEIFYGVKTCVPAFSYMDRQSGKVLRMYESDAAVGVEERLSRAGGEPLLQGGSSYSNIFTGGAEEAHFCAAKVGWGGFLRAVNPLILPLLVLCYLDIFLKTAMLLVIEFFLAVFDSIRGVIRRGQFAMELGFIPARVLACVLLREIVVAGASVDVARGLPVVHLNFIGYDEQSHRRGPSSSFAHWSLQGIDDGIRRLWKAIGKAKAKEYDLWIYSDHGQEKTIPYFEKKGRQLKEVVQEIFSEEISENLYLKRAGTMTWRAGLLDQRKENNVLLESKEPPAPEKLVLTAMGPVGHIYPCQKLPEAERNAAAQRLVNEAAVPLVLAPHGKDQALAWTETGMYRLPEQTSEILGEDHPFLPEIAEDLVALCQHPDAGDLILAGWRKGMAPLSFPVENGSHAGLGAEETSGFAFLPIDTPLKPRSKSYLRPLDLREGAQRVLGRTDLASVEFTAPARTTFRIMTYNVHGCVGMDGKLSPERIARVIARHDVDAVALQELDVNRPRSGGIDQAEKIARKLEMTFHFHPTFRLKDGQYGNAIFSRYPMALMKMGELPKLRPKKEFEPRGALWVTVDFQGMKIHLINTHLSLWPKERFLQAQALVGLDWMAHPDCKGPTILCGDFNALPGSLAYNRFCGVMGDCQKMLDSHKPTHTWMGNYPIRRIDHVFVNSAFEVAAIKVPSTTLDKAASDHLPLITELKLKKAKIPAENR